MKLKSTCQLCQRPLELSTELALSDGYFRSYKCGHSFYEPSIVSADEENSAPALDFHSLNGQKEAFDFQKEGVKFIAKTNFNCLIADPMGLGKTIQALLSAREAKLSDGAPKFKRILVLTKSSCTYQWYDENKEWFSSDLWSCFIIQGTKSFIPPGFRIYIMSMDTLPRFAKNGGLKQIQDLNFDLVIVDECHSFKNADSARSKALTEFLQNISEDEITHEIDLICNISSCKNTWRETVKQKINLRKSQRIDSFRHSTHCPKCGTYISVYQQKSEEDITKQHSKGLILLSGTPIKNRADEYFVPLNLLRPDVFTSSASFKRNWLEQDPETGKYNRIKSWRLDEFRRTTSQFMIRREKSILNLPPFRRSFEKVYIEDQNIATAYNRALKDLASITRNAHKLSYWDVQDNLMTLRRITGLGKIPMAVDFVELFLDSTRDCEQIEKVAIGIHHESVRDILFNELTSRGINCVKLSGEDSADQKRRIVREIQSDSKESPRVAIINHLAGGVGLNLQSVSNILMLERQWNAADEEQFEGRFWRQGQTLPVHAQYMIALFKHGDRYIPTIDTYFSALVENKRQISGETLDGWQFTQDSDALRNLIDEILNAAF